MQTKFGCERVAARSMWNPPTRCDYSLLEEIEEKAEQRGADFLVSFPRRAIPAENESGIYDFPMGAITVALAP